MTQRFSAASIASVNLGKLLFIVMLIALTLMACDEPHTSINVSMDTKVPPTFSFSGPWWAIDFEVIELSKEEPSPENNYSTNDKIVWKISLPEGRRVKSWPNVTYGVIPEGFSQRVPNEGEPPRLVEGKTYAAPSN
jgi:hypothetical protein